MATVDTFLSCSLEDLKLLNVNKLKEVLKSVNESVSGQKASLISRLWAVIVSKKSAQSGTSNPEVNSPNHVVDINIPENCGYTELLVFAEDALWTVDLRQLPDFNFHQLYSYLVVKTCKFAETTMKGTVYKKERSYAFYVEKNISDVKVARNKNLTLVRAKVVASMKKLRYKVIAVFDLDGDVKYAACECPAGWYSLESPRQGECQHSDDSSVRVTSITNLVSEIDLKTEIRAELVTIPEPQLTCEIQFDLDRDFHHITDDELVDLLERPNPAPCWWMRNPLLVLIKKHISQPGAVHKYRGRSDTLQGTSGKLQKLTTEQSILLNTLFKANVAMRRELQKGECDEVIDKYDVLRGLTWKKVLDLDASREIQLSFMVTKGAVYIWPDQPDISWEPTSCVKDVLPEPALSNKSTNRRNYFVFKQ